MANGIKIGNDNATYKVGSTDVSAIYLGNDLVYAPSSGLPAGYTQVEYVENNTLAYIDTGFKPNQDTRIIAEMQVVTSTSYNPHFGCDGWETYNGIRMGYESGINGTLHVKYGNNNGWTVYPNVHGDLNKHTYDWNKNYFYMDGSLVGSYTYGNFQTTSNLGIFFVIENGSPTSQYICYGRVYSFKIYDDGTLVRDFVPCTRDSDSKAGVYDIVNDVFYSSANSGYELIAPQTGYTYSVTIQGLENGDTTRITWDNGIHTDFNVGNGTYTYTTTADAIPVFIETVTDYSLDYSNFVLYSGGSKTVTFTYQGGGGLESIPKDTDMAQYYNRYIKRIVIGDTTFNGDCTINNWGQVSTGYISVASWGVYSGGDFSGISSLPIDTTPANPVQLLSWNYNNSTANPFNDLQIEWA